MPSCSALGEITLCSLLVASPAKPAVTSQPGKTDINTRTGKMNGVDGYNQRRRIGMGIAKQSKNITGKIHPNLDPSTSFCSHLENHQLNRMVPRLQSRIGISNLLRMRSGIFFVKHCVVSSSSMSIFPECRSTLSTAILIHTAFSSFSFGARQTAEPNVSRTRLFLLSSFSFVRFLEPTEEKQGKGWFISHAAVSGCDRISKRTRAQYNGDYLL